MKTETKLQEVIQKVRRVVIKLGSSILVGRDEQLSESHLKELASAIANLQKKGTHVILVTSGAVACGMKQLGFSHRPPKISELQACAAVGQPILMQLYQKALAQSKVTAAQVLITRDDLTNRARFLNAKHTFGELLQRGVIPIINENDSVAVDEIRLGDNDNLAALVTNLVEADLLILLTDQDGFYTADPRADPTAIRIPVIENIDQATLARANGTSLQTSVGGMTTKLEAARKAAQFGIPTIIANGNDSQVLHKIFEAEDIGTLFLSSIDALTARKHWIAHSLKAQGILFVDEGAKKALIEGKKSLLPSGVKGLEGSFQSGDPVDIMTDDRVAFARGLVAYDAKEAAKIVGKKTSEIEALLGYKGPDEIVHRNNLVIL